MSTPYYEAKTVPKHLRTYNLLYITTYVNTKPPSKIAVSVIPTQIHYTGPV